MDFQRYDRVITQGGHRGTVLARCMHDEHETPWFFVDLEGTLVTHMETSELTLIDPSESFQPDSYVVQLTITTDEARPSQNVVGDLLKAICGDDGCLPNGMHLRGIYGWQVFR